MCVQRVHSSILHDAREAGAAQRPAAGEQMNEACVLRPHSGHHSAFKKKDLLTPAATGMNAGDVTLSERRQAQRDKYRARPRL